MFVGLTDDNQMCTESHAVISPLFARIPTCMSHVHLSPDRERSEGEQKGHRTLLLSHIHHPHLDA
jgi:hypothetical protein